MKHKNPVRETIFNYMLYSLRIPIEMLLLRHHQFFFVLFLFFFFIFLIAEYEHLKQEISWQITNNTCVINTYMREEKEEKVAEEKFTVQATLWHSTF